MAFAIPVYAVWAAVAAAAVQTYTSVQAQEEQKKATRAQQAAQNRQQRRQELQEIRERQIAVAQRQAAAASSGTADSSGLAGATSAITSTSTGNIAFSRDMQRTGQYIGNRLNSARNWQVGGQIAGTAIQLGSMAYGAGMFGQSAGQQSLQAGATQQGYSRQTLGNFFGG